MFAGVHLTAERPLRLRRFLRVHHSLLNERRSRPSSFVRRVPQVNIYVVCLVQSGESIMVEVAAGPSDSTTREKVSPVATFAPPSRSPYGRMMFNCCFFQLPMVLKVPRLNSSPLALCDRPFSLLGFGDVLVPGKSCDIITSWLCIST